MKEWIRVEFSKLEREIQELKKEQEESWKSQLKINKRLFSMIKTSDEHITWIEDKIKKSQSP